MKNPVLLSFVLAAVFSGCHMSTVPTSEPITETPVQQVEATPAPQEFPFKSDIPSSEIVRKKAELWEYVGKGFYVPLATMRDSDRAWELARLAQTPKSPSHVQQLVIGGIPYYRALLGPFKSKKAAQTAGKEFEKRKLVDFKTAVEYLAG